MSEQNPLPRYYELLREAQTATDAEYMHNLDSRVLASVLVWDSLRETNRAAQTALVDYVLECGAELRAAFKE